MVASSEEDIFVSWMSRRAQWASLGFSQRFITGLCESTDRASLYAVGNCPFAGVNLTAQRETTWVLSSGMRSRPSEALSTTPVRLSSMGRDARQMLMW